MAWDSSTAGPKGCQAGACVYSGALHETARRSLATFVHGCHIAKSAPAAAAVSNVKAQI